MELLVNVLREFMLCGADADKRPIGRQLSAVMIELESCEWTRVGDNVVERVRRKGKAVKWDISSEGCYR